MTVFPSSVDTTVATVRMTTGVLLWHMVPLHPVEKAVQNVTPTGWNESRAAAKRVESEM